ncbi:AfsR/SARP family transcriptional regulator [Nocardia aurea]|uniref:BTAD domain-containing putative transcriptional regulator n=1 Tax=Nocardia aurea TaxID=2144174 RepID=A0ABV3FS26_9NOCA
MVEFRLLGFVELVVDGRTIDLGPSKQRGIMAVLLAEPDRAISTDILVDRVWDDPPETVRHSVYTYVARLRRILRAATGHTETPVQIRRTFGGYRLEVNPDRIDLTEFRRLLASARAMDADHPDRAATLARALDLWRGEPCAGLDSDWTRNFRESLRQLRHEVVIDRADTGLRSGELKMVSADLRKALMDSPLAEDLHERLLTAYYLDNRSAEALSHYDRMRRAFVAELGVDPGPRLRELHSRLLGRQQPGIPRLVSTRVPAEVARLPDAMTFRGREGEIDRLRQAFTEDTGHGVRPVLVTGGPGIGKSALAAQAATLLHDRFPDGVLRADLGGLTSEPAPPGAVLARLLRGLGLSDTEIPADAHARAARYRELLAERRMLVLLDDAASDEQIAPLVTVGPRSCALITSRVSLGLNRIHTVVLRELTMAESIEILEADVGTERIHAEEWAASALVRCCSGIPLALRAVGARLAARPHWTVAGQLGRMSDEQQRLNEFSYGTLDIRRSMAPTVNRLGPRAAAVFRYLGTTLGPRELFTTVTLPGNSGASGMDALDELVDAHLLSVVEQTDGTRAQYLMLEIHRLYAKQLAHAAAAEPLLA